MHPSLSRDQIFLAGLSQVLAHSLVYERQQEIGSEAKMCGGTSSAGSMEDTASMMQAMTKYYPELSRVISEGALPIGQNLLAAQEALSPRQAALDTAIYKEFGPQMGAVDAEVAAAKAQKQAESDLALLQGTGKDVVAAQRAAQEIADPEYFKARGMTLDALGKLFGSLDDPNGGLSGSERAEIDRSLARSNAMQGIETPTATSTVSNALNFGRAGEARKQARQAAIGAAAETATKFLPAAKSNVDVGSTVLGRPTTTNTGEARLSGPSASPGQSEAMSLGTNMWNQLGALRQTQNQIDANRRDVLDRVSQGFGMIGNLLG